MRHKYKLGRQDNTQKQIIYPSVEADIKVSVSRWCMKDVINHKLNSKGNVICVWLPSYTLPAKFRHLAY